MFNTTKNSKNLGLAFMLCIASLLVDCSSGGGSSGGGGTGPGSATCRNGLGAVGACESCDEGFRLEVGLCNPIPGAPCADGSGSAGACTSCNTGFVLAGGSCFAQVNVSFDLNGGTGGVAPAPLPLRVGSSVTVPSLPAGVTNGTLVFIGWSTLSTNAGANFVRAGNTYIIPAVRVPSATLTLYATWGQAYTVTYNLNGGAGSAPNPSAGVAGAEVTLRALTLTGSNNNNRPANASASPNNGFFGWGVDANGTGITWYTANQSVLFASTTTLYALWYYDITYNCGEGTASGSFPTRTTVRTGEVLTNLPLTGCSPNLTDGSTFVGWSTTGNTPYITTMPNGPITLRAVYVVDLDGDGLIEISTAEQLNNMRYNLAGTSWKTSADDAGSAVGCPPSRCRGYELTADIDLGDTRWGTSSAFVGTRVTAGWEPIGNCGANEVCNDATDTPFTATFEGRGFVIRNLYINRPSNPNETGLFGAISNASVNQAALVNAVVWGSSHTASLVGFQSSGTISHSYATGSVMGRDNSVGGLVGYQNSGTISNSYVTGVVLGNNSTGGLVGWKGGGSISNSYATGAVTASDSVVGGLVGLQGGGSVDNSYATGSVTGSGSDIGGLVGTQRDSSISNSYATGTVLGNTYTGGLVGVQEGASISNSYATGVVMGNNHTGGLVGWKGGGSISNSYATGAVTGSDSVLGGLVGLQDGGSISNSYATGAVTGSGSDVGGLMGSQVSGSIGNSYWDTTTTGQSTSAGSGTTVLGLTTSQIQETSGTYPSLLGSCFRLTTGKYPQLYTSSSGACTTTLLFGPNATR